MKTVEQRLVEQDRKLMTDKIIRNYTCLDYDEAISGIKHSGICVNEIRCTSHDYMELEEPFDSMQLNYFLRSNHVKRVFIEKDSINTDELKDKIILKVVNEVVLNNIGSIYLIKVSDIVDIIGNCKVDSELRDIKNVSGYRIYFKLDDIICRFKYDTRQMILNDIENREISLRKTIENLSNDTLNKLRKRLKMGI